MNIFWLIVLGMFVMHGLGHISGFLTAFTKIPMGFSKTPWIFSKGVTMNSLLGKIFGLVWLVATVYFLLAAYSLFTHQSTWPGYAIPAAILPLMQYCHGQELWFRGLYMEERWRMFLF